MNKPEEVWWFDQWWPSRPVTGPYKVVGTKKHMWLAYKGADKWHIPKEDAYLTKREAVVAHYKCNEQIIRLERKNLAERLQLLKEYYSEEYYD